MAAAGPLYVCAGEPRAYLRHHLPPLSTIPTVTVPTVLVLADDGDHVARRSVRALGRKLPTKIELCTAADLAQAAYFVEPQHESHDTGEIVLRDGRIVLQSELGAIWNRLTSWPPRLAGQKPGAREALTAWIGGFSGSLIGPLGVRSPQACAGWTRLQWTVAAARRGQRIPAIALRAGPQTNSGCSGPPMGEREAVLVVGNRILGSPDLPGQVQAACRDLAQVAGGVLEIRLIKSDAQWIFAEAVPNPDPHSQGQEGLNALAQLLCPSIAQPDPIPAQPLENHQVVGEVR